MTDPHQGGDLNDMAVDGTQIPGDAGVQNIIPSVPRPDQRDADSSAVDLQGAADNAADMPRQTTDSGLTGEVQTATGDQLPAQIESKRFHVAGNEPLAKGHDRYAKHAQQKGSEMDQGEGAEADAAPGEEDASQDEIRDAKGI